MAMSHNINNSGEALMVSNNTEDIFITIKFDSNKTCSLSVKSTTTIGEVKKLAAEESRRCLPSSLNLIFAGQLMCDDKTIEDYNLVGQTTLHAFSVSIKTNADDRDLESVQQSTHNNTGDHRFFVYCKVCDNVNPGKLRVCCRLCGSSLFLVEQGPSNWEDISVDTAIRGQCKYQECSGTVPRFYMKCCHFHELGEREGEGTAVALKHVHANRKQVECIICQDVLSPVLIFPCLAGHVICLECFKQYATTSLNSRQFIEHALHGYTLSCPSGSCQDFHIEDSHHFCLMGIDEYERYKNFGAEEYVLQNGGVLCPGPGCGMGMFPEDDDLRIQCTECQFVSCKHCKRDFHFGSCEENLQSEMSNTNRITVDSERAQRASWETQSLGLIESISKQCPSCKVKTEHSGGCMHMVCTRCHVDWCWLCVKPWDRSCQENHWFGLL